MKRFLIGKLALVLVFTLLLSACGGSGGSSAAGGSSQAAPSAPASTADGSQPPASGEKEPYAIEIYTFNIGTGTYVMGVALADMINKYSTWLTATAMESPGPSETAIMILNEPERRTHAIGFILIQDALLGNPPFDGRCEEFRSLAGFGMSSNLYLTTNPELRTLQDLDGKRVALGTRPNMTRVDIQEKMFEIMGIKPIFEYLPFNDAVTALSDGKVDAYLGGGFAVSPDAQEWVPNPAMAELLARNTVYYIPVDEEGLLAAREALEYNPQPGPLTVPPGKYDANWDEPVVLLADYLAWVGHKDFPDEVVTEILTIMADHAEEFADYGVTGAYVSPENMGNLDMPDWIHPAAQAFYDERGIEVKKR